LAYKRIREGELPCAELPTLWAGPGSGMPCSLCREKITAPAIAYEIEVKAQDCVAAQVLHFHIPCHAAWLFTCNEEPLASTG
jgi:hypothetical protein